MNTSIRLLGAVRYPPYLHFASNGTSQLELQVSGRADPFPGTGPDALPARAWSFELRVFGPPADGLAR